MHKKCFNYFSYITNKRIRGIARTVHAQRSARSLPFDEIAYKTTCSSRSRFILAWCRSRITLDKFAQQTIEIESGLVVAICLAPL